MKIRHFSISSARWECDIPAGWENCHGKWNDQINPPYIKQTNALTIPLFPFLPHPSSSCCHSSLPRATTTPPFLCWSRLVELLLSACPLLVPSVGAVAVGISISTARRPSFPHREKTAIPSSQEDPKVWHFHFFLSFPSYIPLCFGGSWASLYFFILLLSIFGGSWFCFSPFLEALANFGKLRAEIVLD